MLLVAFNIFIGRPACLVFDLQWAPGTGKFEVLSLAPKHVINSGELRFSIRLSVDWQSPIGPLCSNQAERLHLQHNTYFIFLFNILLH
jgi:hypothetical protein